MAAAGLVAFLLLSVLIASNYSHYISNETADDRVKVSLYYESLCPDCKEFISNQLWPTYQEIGAIMDIDLVPYGNAEYKVLENGTVVFRCQHGQRECYGNLVEICAIKLINSEAKALPFIYCTENSTRPISGAQKLDWDAIHECATGDEGNKYMLEMAKKTDALDPPHTFVPWILINDVYTDKNQDLATENLKKLVCNTYSKQKPTNSTEPPACYPY